MKNNAVQLSRKQYLFFFQAYEPPLKPPRLLYNLVSCVLCSILMLRHQPIVTTSVNVYVQHTATSIHCSTLQIFTRDRRPDAEPTTSAPRTKIICMRQSLCIKPRKILLFAVTVRMFLCRASLRYRRATKSAR